MKWPTGWDTDRLLDMPEAKRMDLTIYFLIHAEDEAAAIDAARDSR